MSSISSPELLTPPKPTSAPKKARDIREQLTSPPPHARRPLSVKVAKGAALEDSSPLTASTPPPRKNGVLESGIKSTVNFDLAASHPKCLVLDILGVNRADRGRSCEAHAKCGLSLEENSLVRIRREVSAFNKNGEIVEQAALAVYSVDMGIDRCRVGFLPRAFVQTGSLYDGVLCQASIFLSGIFIS